MEKWDKFRKLSYRIPSKSLAWRIYGKGMENFGDNKKPVEINIPEPGDDEILVRSDAVGLCFSDTKIIKFGSDHPRIHGRDLKKEPVIPGHEVSLTVIKAGKKRKDYTTGSRYIIQADVFYKGKGTAYGYILPGGLSQYGIIGKEILDGDGGSYLIPIQNDELSYSEVALVEPWACVVASYRIKHRKGPKNGGKMLIIGSGPLDAEKALKNWNFDGLFIEGNPEIVVLLNIDSSIRSRLNELLKDSGASINIENKKDIREIVKVYTAGKGFDDIIVLGDSDCDTLSVASDSMCGYGILNYMAETEKPQMVKLDAGKIHYDRISFIGSTGKNVKEPYTENLDYQIKGDAVLLLGAGGPMGQMHVQLALEKKPSPELVVATDIAEERLDTLRDKFDTIAKEKGINFQVINPRTFKDSSEYRKKILNLNNGKLYDYVVCLAAIPSVIEDSSTYLGKKAILNIFAGVSKGTITTINLKEVVTRGVRFIGSSGSSLDDMVYTLRKAEKGELDTNSAVAGVCGMNDVWNGLEAVKNGTFPGKIIVYPHIIDLPLISLKELKEKFPQVGRFFSEKGNWTPEAEKALLDNLLSLNS